MAKSKPRFGRGTGKPHPVDVHVGARLKQRRVLLGMTQTDLAGISHIKNLHARDRAVEMIVVPFAHGASRVV
jgi:hypothetical protein